MEQETAEDADRAEIETEASLFSAQQLLQEAQETTQIEHALIDVAEADIKGAVSAIVKFLK